MVRLTNDQRARQFGAAGHVDRHAVVTPWGARTQVHGAVVGLFLDACAEAARTSGWRPQRVDGYAYRLIRGSSAPSLHGWALAWDFFATPPGVAPPGGVWTPHNGMPPDFAQCFTRRGFTWGALWTRKDVPHIEWAGSRPSPGYAAAPAPPPRRFLPMLSDAEQRELLARLRSLEAKVDDFHLAAERHRKDMRDTLAALTRDRAQMIVDHTTYLRDSMASLVRRLFGVDPEKRNDDQPFWKTRP